MADSEEHRSEVHLPRWKLKTPTGEPITTLPQLITLLLIERAPPDEQRRVLSTFLDLPVADEMPAPLRVAVEARIDG
jgi:hypothetical protein